MSTPNIDTFTAKKIDNEQRRWESLDTQIPEKHRPEYEKIRTQATGILLRMQQALNMPEGAGFIQTQAEALADLYKKGVELQGKAAQQTVRNAFGVQPGQTAEAASEKELEEGTDGVPGGEALKKTLMNYVRALDADPASQDKNNLFTLRAYGTFAPNFREINKARAYLRDVGEQAKSNPAIASTVSRILSGISAIEAQNQKGAAHNEWYQKTFRKMDTKPLQIIGFGATALITTLGLAQTIFKKEHSLSPLTLVYAAAAMFIARPDLLKGMDAKALHSIQRMGTQDALKVAAAGMNGEIGASALEELQTLAKQGKNKAAIHALASQKEPITTAQLGTLVGGSNTPLLKVLSSMNDETKKLTLRTFGSPMSNEDLAYGQKLLRIRESF